MQLHAKRLPGGSKPGRIRHNPSWRPVDTAAVFPYELIPHPLMSRFRHRTHGRAFEDSSMPVISTFFGIYVRMYFADHGPAHVHVEYQGQEALIDIVSGAVLAGSLPRRALALVVQWRMDHAMELAQNWARAQALLPLVRIPGADND